MKTIYCIGELLIDFVAEKQGSDLSKANEFTKKPGGAPANVACAIAKLGGSSKFIGCVGDDPFGTFLLDVLKANHVDISLAQRSKYFTTLAFVSLAENGERDFVFSRGADKKLKYLPEVKKGFNGQMVHLGAATALLGGNLEEAYGRYFFDALTQNAFISFDPNFRGDLWKNNEEVFIKKCKPFVEKAHLCKFSLEEAQLLSGETDLEKACGHLHKIGTQIITITLGGEGTFVSTPTMKTTIPSIEVDPVDTTGAGDAFIGCLLYQISTLGKAEEILNDHELLHKMVKKANIAGALTTTGYGAIPSLPNLEALQAYEV
ncbi:carbohydrate kinase family protein [Pseudozobellia thermophila]|uniref:Fructokinase n=1 Tax=Pseudozobellia thermophila TaxID=192903 RepID=A0A1M6AYM1_9FLAO|nr:carbohydrate kinase [Pseudozobellia thermophila]SHI41609.1 fructokinase [Pseudozobellia thermophila]